MFLLAFFFFFFFFFLLQEVRPLLAYLHFVYRALCVCVCVCVCRLSKAEHRDIQTNIFTQKNHIKTYIQTAIQIHNLNLHT
jgi:hypothetical protein